MITIEMGLDRIKAQFSVVAYLWTALRGDPTNKLCVLLGEVILVCCIILMKLRLLVLQVYWLIANINFRRPIPHHATHAM